MQRSATLTGPGISRSPSAQRRTVRASTSSAAAACTCDMPSAAIAARNSSADTANDPGIVNCQAIAGQDRANRVHVLVLRERIGHRAIAVMQGQAFRAISAARDEADGIGGELRGGDGLAHALNDRAIGPSRQWVFA